MHCARDYFTIDEEGRLYFVDRMDDIRICGEKVSSVEVENVLHEVPGVRLAAAVGVHHETLGQAVRAYVVLQEDSDLTTAEIRSVCRS